MNQHANSAANTGALGLTGLTPETTQTEQPRVALDNVLAQPATARATDAIAARYHLTPETSRAALHTLRPLILQQIAQLCDGRDGECRILHWLADPALTRIRIVPEDIVAQDVRATSDAIHRGLSRGDASLWGSIDASAARLAMSHQTLRAMMPLLTLLLLAAVREAATPAFLRYLHVMRPDDQTTDPYAFAAQQASAASPVAPSQALRWLDAVLSRAQEQSEPSLSPVLRHER
ncbi:MAG: hypothetical protein AAGJ70_03595 [Pseudomonadota bacterium]